MLKTKGYWSRALWHVLFAFISAFIFSRVVSGPFLEFPAFLSDSLEVLYVNDNKLDTVPQSICLLKGLTELYLGK